MPDTIFLVPRMTTVMVWKEEEWYKMNDNLSLAPYKFAFYICNSKRLHIKVDTFILQDISTTLSLMDMRFGSWSWPVENIYSNSHILNKSILRSHFKQSLLAMKMSKLGSKIKRRGLNVFRLPIKHLIVVYKVYTRYNKVNLWMYDEEFHTKGPGVLLSVPGFCTTTISISIVSTRCERKKASFNVTGNVNNP